MTVDAVIQPKESGGWAIHANPAGQISIVTGKKNGHGWKIHEGKIQTMWNYQPNVVATPCSPSLRSYFFVGMWLCNAVFILLLPSRSSSFTALPLHEAKSLPSHLADFRIKKNKLWLVPTSCDRVRKQFCHMFLIDCMLDIGRGLASRCKSSIFQSGWTCGWTAQHI